VHQGEIWLERSHMGTLMGEMIRGAHPGDPHAERIAALTGRERDVIALVGEGLRNDAIGARLSLREKTVRNHLTSIYEKLGVKDRLELAIYAHRHRLATFEPPPAPDAS
jgi:DNA-binding NarL/FixJ family response regulator